MLPGSTDEQMGVRTWLGPTVPQIVRSRLIKLELPILLRLVTLYFGRGHLRFFQDCYLSCRAEYQQQQKRDSHFHA